MVIKTIIQICWIIYCLKDQISKTININQTHIFLLTFINIGKSFDILIYSDNII